MRSGTRRTRYQRRGQTRRHESQSYIVAARLHLGLDPGAMRF